MDASNYHFFWNGILSQWCKTSFRYGGKTYSSCEQFMMHQKAVLFGDAATAAKIMKAKNPREQKWLGRRVKPFDHHKWNGAKRHIVYLGNLLRAKADKKFADTLLATGNKTIVEASPYDAIWGIGFSAADALANKSDWGQNLLGEALMKVRAELQKP